MKPNQNETTEYRMRNPRVIFEFTGPHKAEGLQSLGQRKVASPPHSSPAAFTLVELLVVITIIAILAGLITGAAVNALNRAKQASITLEIQQLSAAIEDFKNEFGAYPPNVFPNAILSSSSPSPINEQRLNQTTLLRHLKKSFSRSKEFDILAGPATSSNNVTPILTTGLSPAEALVFWLQGFSQDVTRPLSGTDLEVTSIDDDGTPTPTVVITIDSFDPRYDFDRGRLRISRNPPPNPTRRFLTVQRPNDTTNYQIQLYEYLAPNSEEPFVYFDTSRETPLQVVNNWDTIEFFYTSPTSGGSIFPLKQLRADAPSPLPTVGGLQFVEYVNARKFQILHCGLDDAWGDFPPSGTLHESPDAARKLATNSNYIPQLLFPTGPFLGDLADTVGNFGTGTLEDEQE